MSDTAPGRFDFLKKSRAFAMSMAAVAALALAGAAGWWQLVAKPEHDALMLRAHVTTDLYALYDLQMAYKKRYGAFCGDLETLLKTAPDGGSDLRAKLQAHTHLDTLVVASDGEKFKLEANVRDAERTLVRVNGPRVGVPLPR